MKIAYVSPMPPQRTGIADYSAALLPYLVRSCGSVDLYTTESVPASSGPASIYPVSDLPSRWRTYDLCLYHLGNNQRFHSIIYDLALAYPGVAVLHDYFLHHLVAGLTIGRGDFPGYLRELAYARGASGADQAYRAARDWSEMPLFEEPLNARLLDVSLGVIVHSRFALEASKQKRPNLRIAYVPAPCGPEKPDSLSRADLGMPEDAFIVAVAGMPNLAKRVDTTLEAMSMLADRFPKLRCAFVGDVLEHADVSAWSGIRDRLLEIGYEPSLAKFLAYLQASDVVVNLRYPSVGEASALTLRALALGKPVVVSNVGWYADLPSDACVKLTHTDDEGADARTLANLLANLIQQPGVADTVGRCGQRYVQREHTSQRVAEAYYSVLNAWGDELYG